MQHLNHPPHGCNTTTIVQKKPSNRGCRPQNPNSSSSSGSKLLLLTGRRGGMYSGDPVEVCGVYVCAYNKGMKGNTWQLDVAARAFCPDPAGVQQGRSTQGPLPRQHNPAAAIDTDQDMERQMHARTPTLTCLCWEKSAWELLRAPVQSFHPLTLHCAGSHAPASRPPHRHKHRRRHHHHHHLSHMQNGLLDKTQQQLDGRH